jgi:diguanylate cyclase (GGDEF)-like protein
MMNRLLLRKTLLLMLIFFLSPSVFAAEKVVLQLKWEHQFQFAGYYAALWQGYYDDEGLDVEIRSAITPDKKVLKPIEEVQRGQAQFSIGSLDILLANARGNEPVLLASFFQKSQLALFSLKHKNIHDIFELAKLRIAVEGSGASRIEIESFFKVHGFDLDEINFVDEPVNLETLVNDKADAIATYVLSAHYEAKEKGLELNEINPTKYGMTFYGDSLFTSRQYLQKNPKAVKDFLKASKKGWIYALNNREEIAERIAREFERYLVVYQSPLEYNRYFAENIDDIFNYPEVEIGHINQERWRNISEKIRKLGITHSDIDDSSFFFDPADAQKSQIPFWLPAITILLIPLVFIFWYCRFRVLTVGSLLIIAFLIESQVEQNLLDEVNQKQRINVSEKLNSISAKLHANLQTDLSLLTGFATYISATPDLSASDFERFAKQLFKKSSMLVNFASAKDLKVNYVYPLAGNESVVGLDYRMLPSQLDDVLRVLKTRQTQIIGPVNLVQGGTAFIGRAPIITSDGKDWGIISAPIRTEDLYKFSGLEVYSDEMKIAIRSYDALGVEKQVFYGDPNVFNDPKRLISVFNVGSDSWHLAAVPYSEDNALPSNIFALRTYFVFAAVFLSIFVWFRFQQEYEKRRLELELRDDKILLESVGSVAKIGGWKLDNQGQFIKWSKQTSKILQREKGFRPATVDTLRPLFTESDFVLLSELLELAFSESQPFDIELQLKTNDNSVIWLRIMSDGISPRTESGITGTIQDITEKVINAKLIEYQATYDSLTCLPNRVLYYDRLRSAIKTADRNQQKLAVLFVDLDRFKPVNDNHGHQAGDQMLIEAANRIRNCIRSSDTVSRLSGDEFAVILVDIPQYKQVMKITEHIIREMQQPFMIDNASIYSSASIGIALYPNDALTADDLLRKADQAMYAVKANGRNGSQFYTTEMQLRSEYRHDMLNKLIEAINTQKLETYFQPIFNLETGKIERCETLARWKNDQGDFVPPSEFISLAEESGLINRIDLFMLEKSGEALTELASAVELSINISPRLFQTKDKALETWMASIIMISQSIDITVEITERLLTEDSEIALKVLTQLKEYDIKIAIDDFGTGYSSLSYLIKYPVDVIKIDRSFVGNIGTDSSAEPLIETILAMAERLDIKVVAEGIETQEQLDYLKRNRCHFGQGYLLGRPMDTTKFTALFD